MVGISLTVNGVSTTAEVEGRTLLVEFLRDTLGLTGTHVGCDTSQCGACTVHVDGMAIKSCTVFVGELDGAGVVTIEALSERHGGLTPLQKSFQDHHGLQCGYCTPGMIMSLTALIEDNAKPSEAEIRRHLEGNICRCTGYVNIVKAALAATGQLDSAMSASHDTSRWGA